MSKAIRDVYGEALAKYGKDDKRVVVLPPSVSSTLVLPRPICAQWLPVWLPPARSPL